MNEWPVLEYAPWARTKRTLHLIAQMLGKVRLALAPHQPNFQFAALYMAPDGITTSPIPVGLRLVELRLDVVEARIVLLSSDRRRREIAFAQLPSIASTYNALLDALRAIDVDVVLSPIPQEIADRTPFDRDENPPIWEVDDAHAWLTAMSSTQAVFDRWRAHFFGRTGLQLWWGALDLTLLLFTGKHVPAPLDRGYLFRYDLDAEMMNAGLYPGDDATEPFYYGYIYPEPAGCSEMAIADGTQWSDPFREWILPYSLVRAAPRPEELLHSFLDGIYATCSRAAHWNDAEFTYQPPPLRHGPLRR
ncbi:MAG TPA: DUF5996 family protein [Candidatus Binatia bacterium]|nr:DUF5996 family protein [Candidatus Binatia bacterium]